MKGAELTEAVDDLGMEADQAEVYVETGSAGALERLPVLSVYMMNGKVIISGAVVN